MLTLWAPCALQAWAAQPDMSTPIQAQPKAVAAFDFVPRDPAKIPPGEFGDKVRKGYDLMVNTQQLQGRYVGNHLNCSNCHLNNGAQAYSTPLWAGYLAYPAYRAKDHHVDTFAERVQGCFNYSMNGKAPALDSPEVVAISAYAYWLLMGGLLDLSGQVGAPVPELSDKQLQQGGNDPSFVLPEPIAKTIEQMGRQKLPGRGFPALPAPASAPSPDQGQQVYTQHCAVCHGANGDGTYANGMTGMPPLWGEHSYNWGAGMHRIDTAAQFISENMPLGKPIQLTPTQAWDVAAYINSQKRPQDPRFNGNLTSTAHAFHGAEQCYYGQTVEGVLLGGEAQPSATGVTSTPSAK
ncbi:c-type cytochrome [Pseudomonas sp. MYb118]|uniref:c-type cytochrome n=1 Tax=Pseudomonas sp. MYb118 TaxID=1848720 RepID=UPI0034CFCF22